jgi:hypothetical protein
MEGTDRQTCQQTHKPLHPNSVLADYHVPTLPGGVYVYTLLYGFLGNFYNIIRVRHYLDAM